MELKSVCDLDFVQSPPLFETRMPLFQSTQFLLKAVSWLLFYQLWKHIKNFPEWEKKSFTAFKTGRKYSPLLRHQHEASYTWLAQWTGLLAVIGLCFRMSLSVVAVLEIMSNLYCSCSCGGLLVHTTCMTFFFLLFCFQPWVGSTNQLAYVCRLTFERCAHQLLCEPLQSTVTHNPLLF